MWEMSWGGNWAGTGGGGSPGVGPHLHHALPRWYHHLSRSAGRSKVAFCCATHFGGGARQRVSEPRTTLSGAWRRLAVDENGRRESGTGPNGRPRNKKGLGTCVHRSI